jgi:methyltransferase (TIGR00027 family)
MTINMVLSWQRRTKLDLMIKETRVEDVSDTALWVANYRARETDRPDALFKDPLAAKLSGERGKKIADLLGYPGIMTWVMAIRTVAIDRLILKSIEMGVDTVINLGAGLDTRPYRMNLPKNLNWIEVDFSHMIEFKNSKLADDKPVCGLERFAADLSQAGARQQIFKQLGEKTKKALIITEGVIPYLSDQDAADLAKDLRAIANFEYWVQDYRMGGPRALMPRRFRKHLKDAPFIFSQKNWLGYFESFGWRVNEKILALDLSKEVNRPFTIPFPWNVMQFFSTPSMREKALAKYRLSTGYVLFQKS